MFRATLAALLGLGLVGSSLLAQPPKGKDAPPKKESGKGKTPPKADDKAKKDAGKAKAKDADKPARGRSGGRRRRR